MSQHETLTALLERVEAQRGRLETYRQHWHGEQPAAFLSTKSRDALDSRLSRLSVNLPRLVVSSLAERQVLEGFRRPGTDDPDPALWALWRRAGMVARSELVHTDRLIYGSSFVTVWGEPGQVAVTADNPLTMAVDTDPTTGETERAVRRWHNSAGAHALVYTPEAVTRWHARGEGVAGAGGWRVTLEVDNPFGVVPVVPFVRRESVSDTEGTSAMADVLDLSDGLAKVLQDALVTSEYFARPRRWATGLEVEEDDEGNPIDPFANDRKLVSESPDTKFGQLDSSSLDGYNDLTATFTQLVGALTGLPPHYLGLHGDQPANADSVRAAEAQLTSRAYGEMRQLDESWSQVAALILAMEEQRDVASRADAPLPVWRSPEIRTPAQAADAAAKLHGIGLPLASLLTDPLGYDPQRADRIAQQARAEALNRAGTDLSRYLP